MGAPNKNQDLAGLLGHDNHTDRCSLPRRGKARKISVRHDLDRWLTAYIEGVGLRGEPKGACSHTSIPVPTYADWGGARVHRGTWRECVPAEK